MKVEIENEEYCCPPAIETYHLKMKVDKFIGITDVYINPEDISKLPAMNHNPNMLEVNRCAHCGNLRGYKRYYSTSGYSICLCNDCWGK